MKTVKIKHVHGLLKWVGVSFVLATMLLLITGGQHRANVLLEQITDARPMWTLTPPNNNWRNFTNEQIGNMSALGKILFLEEPTPPAHKRDTPYKILMWKYGKNIEKRHFYHFTNHKFDPFEKCSVRNCEITYDDKQLNDADAVVVHLQRVKGVQELPAQKGPRPEHQRWVFLTDENPMHTFMHREPKMSQFNGIFNWSMTYRFESDVPVPYGRTVLRSGTTSQEDMASSSSSPSKRSDVLLAIMGSNCGGSNHRWQYVKELQKYIAVDVYGNCGTLKCPGHFTKDCEPLNQYKFYLSFENSNCAQYITEKLWWNAYAKGSIPVVMGASRKEYSQLLPPGSYIAVEDFARPVDLARYILYINKTHDLYHTYFQWKQYYQVLNEHGYFQTDSFHYCRLCQALNYNSKQQKVYNDLDKFWSSKDCYPKWDDQ